MSAKEMFEKLGYKDITPKIMYDIPNTKYEKKTNSIRIIEFVNSGKYIDITETFKEPEYDNYDNYNYIDFEELRAINKQVEELGW